MRWLGMSLINKFLSWLNSLHVLAAFLAGITLAIHFEERLLAYSNQLHNVLQVCEPYLYITSEPKMVAAIMLGGLLLLSDCPFLTPLSQDEMLRIGRKKWISSQICYIFLASLLYFTTVWAICICGTAVWRLGLKNGIQFFLLFLPNLLLWSAVGLVGYTRSKKAAWSSCIPIALIGGFCLIGSYFPKLLPYLPSTWGMLSIALPCKGLWAMSFASFLSATVFYLVFIIYEEKQNGNY